jgi:RHS repeat-associated protein
MDFVDAGWVRVPEAAGTSAAALYLPENKPIRFGFENTIAIEQAGYVYIWVGNQSEQARVWFDDITVTHTQTMVTQAMDYGVWGDVLREMKAAEFTYRFGYQGQFAEKDEETGWNHFELREYDAVIGRWTSKDPYSQYYSLYVGMGNDPVNGTDPDGGLFFGLFGSTSAQRQAARNQASLTGGEINNLLSKNISVSFMGNEWIYEGNIGGHNYASNYFWEYTFEKDGSYNVSIDLHMVSTMATGRADFDPLGQLAVVQPLVGGARALASGTVRVGQGVLFGTNNRVFWSGGLAGSAGEAAGSYAAANGAITLEMTFAGRTLTGLTNMTSYSFTKPLWNLASRGFANGARGTANVFINPTRLSSSSIWLNTERGILRANGVQYQYHIIPH